MSFFALSIGTLLIYSQNMFHNLQQQLLWRTLSDMNIYFWTHKFKFGASITEEGVVYTFGSGKKGVNTILAACISSLGTSSTPIILLQRNRMAPHLMKSSPPGSDLQASQTGRNCMYRDLFVDWLIHFMSTLCSFDSRQKSPACPIWAHIGQILP